MRTIIVMLLLWLAALPARAEVAFIMVPKVEERVAPVLRQRVLEATSSALRAYGFTVTDLDAAKVAGVECAEEQCVPASLDALKADLGVRVSMMTTPGASTPALGSIAVSFHLRSITYESRPVRVLDQGIEHAVDNAITSANALKKRGPGPWLTIEGTPHDAVIVVNGERIGPGTLPREVRVPPNQTVEVRAERSGYRSQTYSRLIGDNPASSFRVLVELQPTYDTSLPPPGVGPVEVGEQQPPRQRAPATERQRTWKDWTLGGVLLAGGSLVAANGLKTLVRDGDRFDDEQTVHFGARSKALVAVGGAMVLAAPIMTFWVKPFGVRVRARAGAGHLQLSATF